MKESILSLTKKDFKVTYFSGSGGGGQHRNKHKNCVRITHPESQAIGTGQETKSRIQNQKRAFKNLTQSLKFNQWLKIEIAKTSDEYDRIKIEKIVEEMMNPKNIKVEYF